MARCNLPQNFYAARAWVFVRGTWSGRDKTTAHRLECQIFTKYPQWPKPRVKPNEVALLPIMHQQNKVANHSAGLEQLVTLMKHPYKEIPESRPAPFFSVVVPTYNKSDYIAQCIESVLNQTYMDFELIVIDDGSTDESRMIVERYHDRRVKLISQSNQGVSAARNKGVLNARSNRIAFLDADDLWMPNFLEIAYRDFLAQPTIVFWSCGYEFLTADTIRVAQFGRSAPKEAGFVKDYFVHCLADPIVTSSTVILTKELLERIEGFPEREALGEDLVTWARATRHAQLYFQPLSLARYRVEGQNNHSLHRQAPRRRLLVLEELEGQFATGDLKALSYYTVYSAKSAYRQVRSGRPKFALWIMFRSISKNLGHGKILLTCCSFLYTARVATLIIQRYSGWLYRQINWR